MVFRVDGAPADPDLLRRMIAATGQRGGSAGEKTEGAIGLAHWRVPTSVAGAQPLLGGAGLRVVVTGRLYNRESLFDALRRPGQAPFDSDAEAVLAAYAAWGPECVERLDGDFAFALHDGERRSLLCARDPFGLMPLFYAFDGRNFMAATQQKQLLAAGVSAEPCEEAIAAYVSMARHLTGGSRTYFRDVHSLEPGHTLVVDAEGLRSRAYWQPDADLRVEEKTDEDLAERVRELMTDAVRRRLPERGPYACALTGGLDSASVAGLTRLVLDERGVQDALETISFEMRDPESDEPELIDAAAEQVRARHHHVYLDRDNVFEVLPELIRAGNAPTRDMGLLYLWRKKERAASLGIDVVLSGLGGDELFFGGYQYFADLLRSGRLVSWWREARALYPIDPSSRKRTSLGDLLLDYTLAPLLPRAAKWQARRLFRGESAVPPWVRASFARRSELSQRVMRYPAPTYRDAYRLYGYEGFQQILVSVALPAHLALGAKFGVDTRFPFLDRRLVEYMFAVPREHKVREGQTRLLQRRAMKGILPEVVVRDHVKKNIHPVLQRQQRPHFGEALAELFARPRLECEEYLDGPCLREHYRRFAGGSADTNVGNVLWHALNLEIWLTQQAF